MTARAKLKRQPVNWPTICVVATASTVALPPVVRGYNIYCLGLRCPKGATYFDNFHVNWKIYCGFYALTLVGKEVGESSWKIKFHED